MTVLEVIQRSSEYLTSKGVDSPRLQIELLLAHVLQMPRLKLYLNFDRPLSPTELDQVRALVKRRGGREPLQHLLGTVNFCGLELKVNRDVLIPRPETELLAERACARVTAHGPGPIRVLDFCTGSGCLAIWVAFQCPQVEVDATDISEAALAVARENASRHGVAARIQFWCGDGLKVIPAGRTYQLLVSNPPYIASGEIETLQPEVRDYDPRLALDGGADGLDFYRQLAKGAGSFLLPKGEMLLELGDGQGLAVSDLLRAHGWEVDPVQRDDSGRERILIARRLD